MAIGKKIRGVLGIGGSTATNYECQDCSRTFEIDAPPERVICSQCGSEDVEAAQ